MQISFVVYIIIAFGICCLDIYCAFINFKCADDKCMFTIFNLLFSVFLVCIGCCLSLVNCQASWFLIFVGLSALCVWQAFVQYVTYTSKTILWNSARLSMLLISYLIPIIFSIISIVVIKNKVILENTEICLIQFNTNEILAYQLLQVFFFFGYQLIFLIFAIIDSIKSLAFIEKQKQQFLFLEGSSKEMRLLPIFTSLLILIYFIQINLQYWFTDHYQEIVNKIFSILMEFDLLIIVIQYGFNPTVLRITSLKQLYQFRTRLEKRYLNKLLEGSGSTFYSTEQSENELGDIMFNQ